MGRQTEILKQIDAALDGYKNLRSPKGYGDFSDIPEDVSSASTFMRDCIQRLAPPNSQYVQAMNEIVKAYGVTSNGPIARRVAGVLTALREAYASDYLTTVSELIHADLFSDFIEMAEYLLSEGYKDPAAVIVGSTLEEHLRQLCAKNGLPTTAGGKPKKAGQLNADLALSLIHIYCVTPWVTAWAS